MKQGIKIAVLAMAAMLATGCTTWNLEELRQTTPTGNAFQKALAQHYLDFAESEAEQYDWWSQMYFAGKGLQAAYGKDVAPEDLKDWTIPAHAQESLEKAHDALMDALTPQAMEKKPQDAADAQFFFDCWVEQQQEDWQDDDIAHCRDGFAMAMQKLSGTYKEEKHPKEPAKPKHKAKTETKAEATPETQPEVLAEEAAPAAAAPVEEAPAKKSKFKGQDVVAYVVFFEWNQSTLSAQGVKVTQEVIDLLKNEDHYEVILNGHSDTAESGKDDFSLSQRRADAVKQHLVEGGVHEDAIKTFAFGSSDPHIKTGAGIKEPANRRVEIFLND